MESFSSLLSAFVSTPLPAMLVLALGALGWLFKDSRARDEKAAAALAAANTAHLATAMQVAPLATKLVTCVEVLERLTNAQLARGGQ